MSRITVGALAAVAVALIVAACGNEETRNTAPETIVGSVPADTGGAPAETGGEPAAPAGEGDPAAGEAIFASAGCGSCHTLSAAGTSGTVGPNLDDAQPDIDLVVDRVTNGAGAMPSFSSSLSEQDIADVAAYVVASTSG
jgi:mono/diheme cytochrome c family protein